MESNNRKKRRRDSCSDEDNVLRKKRRLNSNQLKKGGKYVPQQKSLKELKDELDRLVKYATAQTQINNFNARHHNARHHNTCHHRRLVLPPFSRESNTHTNQKMVHRISNPYI